LPSAHIARSPQLIMRCTFYSYLSPYHCYG
jgi:hypothetical protein